MPGSKRTFILKTYLPFHTWCSFFDDWISDDKTSGIWKTLLAKKKKKMGNGINFLKDAKFWVHHLGGFRNFCVTSIFCQWLTQHQTIALQLLQFENARYDSLTDNSIFCSESRSSRNRQLGTKWQRTNLRGKMPLSTSICTALPLQSPYLSFFIYIYIVHKGNNSLRQL